MRQRARQQQEQAIEDEPDGIHVLVLLFALMVVPFALAVVHQVHQAQLGHPSILDRESLPQEE